MCVCSHDNSNLSTFFFTPPVPSFGEISNSTIFGDVKYLVLGYVVMFIYIQMMLGRCNMVEHRVSVRPGITLRCAAVGGGGGGSLATRCSVPLRLG